jgi:hypothetical protein
MTDAERKELRSQVSRFICQLESISNEFKLVSDYAAKRLFLSPSLAVAALLDTACLELDIEAFQVELAALRKTFGREEIVASSTESAS